jgi:hypothetical protein
MDLKQTWNGLCTPAQLYAVLSLVSIILMASYERLNGAIIVQALFAIVWTFVLGWICNKGWTGVSWFLVLFPIVLVVISFIMVLSEQRNKKNDTPVVY